MIILLLPSILSFFALTASGQHFTSPTATPTVPSTVQRLTDVPDFPKFKSSGFNPDDEYKSGPGMYCCLRAVYDQYHVKDGVIIRSDSVDYVFAVTSNLDQKPEISGPFFLSWTSEDNSQFPCDALYDIDRINPAPTVLVPYRFCRQNCAGWKLSSTNDLNSWLQPFIGFILPAIFFSFTVPRKRKFTVEGVLPFKKWRKWKFTLFLAGAIPAFLITIIDGFIQLTCVIAFAGPMLASGFLEALLDHRVLDYAEAVDMPFREKFHLMFITLVGNLDQTSAWDQVKTIVQQLPDQRYSDDTSGRLQGDEALIVSKLKRRLKAMLACQYDFGPIVGIPVMFYLGSFVFICLEIRLSLGDEYVSQALSYGIFWMICPHVAIVAGLLLAGNNPNTLEAIAPGSIDRVNQLKEMLEEKRKQTPLTRFQRLAVWYRKKLFVPIYESIYQPVRMWKRGQNKHEWLLHLYYDSHIEERQVEDPPSQQQHHHHSVTSSSRRLHSILTIRIQDWFWIFFATTALFAVPCILSIITIVFTPAVGISCRSLSYILYTGSQFVMLALWFAEVMCWGMPLPPLSSSQTHTEKWTDPSTRRSSLRPPRVETVLSTTLSFLSTLISATSIFTSIGSTLMQLMGVFKNCLCEVPARYWRDLSHPDALIPVGSNSFGQQYYAGHFWLASGLAAAIYLVVVTFAGWWWQTRLRAQFRGVLEELPEVINREEGHGVGGLVERTGREVRSVFRRRRVEDTGMRAEDGVEFAMRDRRRVRTE